MNLNTPIVTDNQKRKAVLAVIHMANAVVEAVRDSGPLGLPEGHAYAACMGAMTLEQFTNLINLLVEARRIKRGPSHTLVLP